MKYFRYSDYLKRKFGRKVYKICVNAGFSCPNRDGKLSREGWHSGRCGSDLAGYARGGEAGADDGEQFVG